MMTKKHFIKIAKLIKENTIKGQINLINSNFLSDLCEFFKQENPLFDRNRFKNSTKVLK